MNVTSAEGSLSTTNKGMLTMYVDSPSGELSLEDFEILAWERLKVLNTIEKAMSSGQHHSDTFKSTISKALAAHLEANPRTSLAEMTKEEREELETRDERSHHILRLAFAFSHSDDDRRRFVTLETQLFRYRAENVRSDQELNNFMARNELNFERVDEDDLSRFSPQLRTMEKIQRQRGYGKENETVYYKVHFTKALDLVRSRQVFVHGGFAFVPRTGLVSLLVNKFEKHLQQRMLETNGYIDAIMKQDERLKGVLAGLPRAYVGPQYGSNKTSLDSVGPDDIDGLAASAFPLCMQHMHKSLKEKHKLKHLGRLQYGLFLKGVGLRMEDALVFWQREFTKAMTVEEFLKTYAYNIRYNYGKEGKRADFTPYSCVKIITAPAPSGDEAHGCPYKNWDLTTLGLSLAQMKLTAAANDIVESVRKKDYQVACRKQFEARFPGADSTNVGNHPNAYIEAANKALRAEASGERVAAVPPPPSFKSAVKVEVVPSTGAGAGAVPRDIAYDS